MISQRFSINAEGIAGYLLFAERRNARVISPQFHFLDYPFCESDEIYRMESHKFHCAEIILIHSVNSEEKK